MVDEAENALDIDSAAIPSNPRVRTCIFGIGIGGSCDQRINIKRERVGDASVAPDTYPAQ